MPGRLPGGGGVRRWVRDWVVFLTMAQWRAIDAEYRLPGAGVDVRGAATFVLVAAMLLVQRFFGGKRFFRKHFAEYFTSWPLSDLYPHLYWVLGCTVVYFVIPALFVKLVYRERISDYGWRIRGTARHIPLYLLMLAVVLPFVVMASATPGFLHRYPFYAGTSESLTQFFAWELAYGFQFVVLEFFFRGFMVFTLARYIGAYAVFAMVVPYTMIHFSKPALEATGAIIAGTVLGTLALRTRSILGGICIHIAVAWSMDLMALWRKGALTSLF